VFVNKMSLMIKKAALTLNVRHSSNVRGQCVRGGLVVGSFEARAFETSLDFSSIDEGVVAVVVRIM
jgi:hypothetical protein